ncbi:hypothetical protein ACUUL3_15185 [Thiovibrio sp. JS02]
MGCCRSRPPRGRPERRAILSRKMIGPVRWLALLNLLGNSAFVLSRFRQLSAILLFACAIHLLLIWSLLAECRRSSAAHLAREKGERAAKNRGGGRPD